MLPQKLRMRHGDKLMTRESVASPTTNNTAMGLPDLFDLGTPMTRLALLLDLSEVGHVPI